MIGKYGMMRRTYLEENRPVMYAQMLRAGSLQAHLKEMDELARNMVREQTENLLKSNPAPEKSNQLAWVGHMNSLKHAAEEMVLRQLVYA